MLALQIDVDFSDAGRLSGGAGLKFGDLTLCNMTPATLNNLSVRNYATIVNALLSGGSSGGFTTADVITLDPITEDIASAFEDGTPSDFAQQHLVHGSCGWKDGDFLTYSQTAWGNGGSGNATLVGNYGTVYASTAGGFLIGVATGFTALWTDVSILSTYLPASGGAAALTSSITDATSSSSGVYGGDVAALKLNIDFNDAGFLKGNANVKFGDLRLCGFSTLPALNGTIVRQFLATANTALGGEATARDFRSRRCHASTGRRVPGWNSDFVRASAPRERHLPLNRGPRENLPPTSAADLSLFAVGVRGSGRFKVTVLAPAARGLD